jgi:hypothetical protein
MSCLAIVLTNSLWAQPTAFIRADSIPVFANNNQLVNPWAGGMNFCQFSAIDLDLDGTDDLFSFDRTGYKITTYINGGTANQVDYHSAPEYISRFPDLHDWVILRDYNCDGMADIFSYSVGGTSVYKNISTIQNGLQFQLVVFLLHSDRSPNSTHFMSNIPISRVDIPVIRDLDGDGDLDILTFGQASTEVEYHRNMSMEVYGNCDSLNFRWEDRCWGKFQENSLNASITLNTTCPAIPIARPDPNQTDYSTVRMGGFIDPNLSDAAHAGSCMECLNTDGDNDQEVLIGDLSNAAMTFLHNGGTNLLAQMDSIDAQYPNYDLPVAMTIFPCPYRLDVNNDGADDLIFTPNAENTSENHHSNYYYKNIQTTNTLRVDFVQNDFMQDGMIELGEGCYPTFFDYDNDGRVDLLVGNYGYHAQSGMYPSKIALYRNTGSTTNPSYTLITPDFANIYASNLNLLCLAPTFGDIDGDGDKDMLIGSFDGRLHLFRKDPGPADNFVLAQSFYQGIDNGNFAAPQLIDLNRDGLLDILLGDQNGKLWYHQNTGTATNASFAAAVSFFGGVDVRDPYSFSGYSTPCVYEENNQYRMLVGSERGFIYKYGNIDNNLSGQFTLIDSMYISTYEGGRLAPSVKDINNDGMFDVVIGNYSGGLTIFYGDNNVSTGAENELQTNTWHVYPNPAKDMLTVDLSAGSFQDGSSFVLFDLTGREVLRTPITRMQQQIDVSAIPTGVYASACITRAGISQRGRVVITH